MPVARAAGAADAVDVHLRHFRQLVVDHVRNAVDVEAAGRDVGRHQHRRPVRLERRQRALADALALVAVDRRGPNAGAIQVFTILSAPCFVRANTIVRVNGVFCKKCVSNCGLCRCSTKYTDCSTSSTGVATGADLNVRRIAQPFGGQLANLGRHRGREHQRLPRLRHRGHDLAAAER